MGIAEIPEQKNGEWVEGGYRIILAQHRDEYQGNYV